MDGIWPQINIKYWQWLICCLCLCTVKCLMYFQSLCMTMALRQSRLKWLNPLLSPRRHAEKKPTPVPATHPHLEQYTPAMMGRSVSQDRDTSVRYSWSPPAGVWLQPFQLICFVFPSQITCLFICYQTLHVVFVMFASVLTAFIFFSFFTFILEGKSIHPNVNKPQDLNSKYRSKDAITQELTDRPLT